MANPYAGKLRNQVIYSVYVRQYSKEGTFEQVRRDLLRIHDLGVDVIWFLPIHPIGIKERKGTLGSPYAIRDYRAVNPEFGTMADFRTLVDDIHHLGMQCMIDVVYNHTSPDSVLMAEHPEWFYRKPDGSFGNKVGEWLDVIDLDYAHPALWEYQIETLRQWAEIVDGFRCDVAPLLWVGKQKGGARPVMVF
jgi:glycosidase